MDRDAVGRGTPSLSLFFFSSHGEDQAERYSLFLDAARIADASGIEAVWIPERHFDKFGGLFPNPSLLGVALAMSTKNVRIRAGSVVMPLQDPLRVAEEWAVVDNLSGGRVDLAFAQGWNPVDFALAPERYDDRLTYLYDGIETVKRLWHGGTAARLNGKREPVEVRTFPPPVQRELACWLTCIGGEERFRDAGTKGFNVLTGLLFQSYEDLERNLSAYRRARAAAGHAGPGRVTLMLHSFVGETEKDVLASIRGPLKQYLKDSFPLWRGRFEHLNDLSEANRELLWEVAFQRYYQTSGFFGAPEKARTVLAQVAAAGVDELACLIDFGIDPAATLAGVKRIGELAAATVSA